ncbi:MAG: MGDG synthase family glycosyltransferase [Clostridium sp.]
MKKVIILTTSTGQGHNQAASTLCEVFEHEGFKAIKSDFLAINSVVLNKTVVKGYELGASIFPHFYGCFYKLTNLPLINSLLKIPFKNAEKRLWDFINKEKPDIIISTHPLGVNMLHRFKCNGLKTPCISIVTDFKAHYTYISPLINAYITGSEYTKNSLIEKGISSNVIYPAGIPIKEIFFKKTPSTSQLNNNYFNILLMGGSMGLNKISKVLDQLLVNKNNLNITVICGNNLHLKSSLSEKNYDAYANIKVEILGFTKNIPELMDKSDVIISKPGGLTVSESIAKNLPIIIPFAIPGQEKENTEFLCNNGYAINVPKLKNLNNIINNLISNPNELTKMRKNLVDLSSTYNINKIVEITKELINS